MVPHSNHSRHGVIATAHGASKPRRRFLGALVASIGVPLIALVAPLRPRTPADHLRLQDRRIAGSQYHDCDAVLPRLCIGDALRLRRQSENPHDERAIEVFWRRHKLGWQ